MSFSRRDTLALGASAVALTVLPLRVAAAPTTEEGRALAVLDLTMPVEFATIKARYIALVKEHHPDANGGSKDSEEKLKSINLAFGVLKASFGS